MKGRLVVCPTPIGNLEDVTLRVLSSLREADIVACEDTRRTRTLLDRYGVRGKLISYREQNERERARELVEKMVAGERRRARLRRGHAADLRPGLPARPGVRRRRPGGRGAAGPERRARRPRRVWPAVGPVALRRLPPAQAAASSRPSSQANVETLVAFESPKRTGRSLAVLAEIDPDRPVAVCRELTKVHEEVLRGTAAELAARYAEEDPRGRGRPGDRRGPARALGGVRSARRRPRAGRRRSQEAAGRGRRRQAHRQSRRTVSIVV